MSLSRVETEGARAHCLFSLNLCGLDQAGYG